MEFKEEAILKLKKLIKELKSYKGRHTELVSVYIPADYNITEIINQLTQEKSTAMNIKSKTTRKNVLDALEKIIQHLRLFKKTPENGLVVFCGNVSQEEGKPDIKLWSFEPPEKLKTKIYWCDQVFVLEPLEEMIEEKEVYGLIVLDAREANIGLLKGKSIIPLKHFESTVPSKSVKGGMSQKRYDRIREDALHEFLKKVGESASQLFLEQKNLKGIIIGGPGPTKENFAERDYLHYQLKKKVLGVKDVSYTGEYGLEELVERSQDLLKEASISKERELLINFFSELKNNGKAVYGLEDTLNALNSNAVDILLISEDFDWVRAKLKCSQCNYFLEKDLPERIASNQVCPKCKKNLALEESKNLADILKEMAENLGVRVEFISTTSKEGIQFKQIGGVGALLKYKIEK